MNVLDELDGWKSRYGEDPAPLERLLRKLSGTRFRSPADLIRLHETLLFLRAYPHSDVTAGFADEALAVFSGRLSALADDFAAFEEADASGIAGTSISAVFTYETARSLAQRYPDSIDVDWEYCDNLDRLGPVLAEIAPLASEEWPVEAHFPARQYVEALKAESQTSLQWLLRRIEKLPGTDRHRADLYDRMNLMLAWDVADTAAARTHTRFIAQPLHVRNEPLIRRRDVSIERELALPPLPLVRLNQGEARSLLNVIVDTSAVRYRELYGFSHPELKRVYRASPGRGLDIYFFGVPPEWRLPLRAYHAGMFFKNGVPSGYVEILSFFERAEVGFNLYYTFREGETAWIYAQILRLAKQLLGVTRYFLDPYQIGHENEEAVESGAFWFYRKLGFRSVYGPFAHLVIREESRIARDPAYRTPPATLRKLASEPMIYEPPDEDAGEWDNFQIRNLALKPWPVSVKRSFEKLRPAKQGREEAQYLRLMQRDPALRAELILLGSGPHA